MNNEPAFPFIEPEKTGYSVTPGITLRDYFAAMAMQGQLAGDPGWDLYKEDHVAIMAKTAYRMADAMLEARNK